MYVIAKLIRTQGGLNKILTMMQQTISTKAELMQQEGTDANTRMHDALRAEHKTNYPKDEPDEQ